MRYLTRIVERALTPYLRLSDCRLNKHRLINSLGAKVSERIWDVLSGGKTPQRFLTAKISRILSESRWRTRSLAAGGVGCSWGVGPLTPAPHPSTLTPTDLRLWPLHERGGCYESPTRCWMDAAP